MRKQPLATRMRPKSLVDIVGQNHLLDEGRILSRMVKSNQVSSIILYGPPGTGKTSIAHALSKDLNIPFKHYNASIDSKKELQNAVVGATPLSPVIMLLDEIHRLTKPNQDFLLKYIEEGSVVLVGATTENPYMSITPALRSRSSIFELVPISPEHISEALNKALTDEKSGLGLTNVSISKDLLLYIGYQSNGDLRLAMNTLELAVNSTDEGLDDQVDITKEIIDSCLQVRQIGGDKDGDSHYNLLSAFQKSIRGSDVDASLHYLARLIEAGDLVSILRRLLVISYEDIGLADHNIHNETLNAVETAERVGLPEARIPLSYIVIRLALSRKSNVAYKAIDLATHQLSGNKDLSIPKSIHDNHYKGAKSLEKGIGYKYSHNYPYGLVNQQYLPDDYVKDRYLEFRDDNDTADVKSRYENINSIIKDNR